MQRAANVIFVFGSNLEGKHGKGAAKTAKDLYGAKNGVTEGRTGNAYAIPTKDKRYSTLPPSAVKESLKRFFEYAHQSPDLIFLMSPVGCGLAGFTPKEILAMTQHMVIPDNVYLTSTWLGRQEQ